MGGALAILGQISIYCRTLMSQARGRQVMRHCNAAHLMAFIGLSSTYQEDIIGEYFARYPLLTHDELEHLAAKNMDGGIGTLLEVMTWAFMDVQDAFQKGEIDKDDRKMIFKQLFYFRGKMTFLYGHALFPVPLFYVHFVYFITGMYLP